MDELFGQFAGYQPRKKIASGGIADIYEATDLKTGQKVVLKILKEEWSGNEEIRWKFQLEATLQTTILNPHIVQVYDILNTAGHLIMVQEFVEGISLWHQFKKAKWISEEQRQQIALQLADGVSAIHHEDIIHCDLKPLNLILESSSGLLKICDFGNAVSLDQIQDGSWKRSDLIWGSPLYMAPEQCRGEIVSKATDVYAIGIILYRLYAGQLPLYSEDADAVINMQCSVEPYPPDRLNPEIPGWLNELIQKAVQKQPHERYPDADALYQALSLGYNMGQGNL